MQRVFRFISVMTLAAGLLTAAVPVVFAQATPDKAKVQADISASKKAEAALSKKSQALEEEVDALKKKLVDMSRQLRQREDTLARTSEKLSVLKKKKADISAELYQETAATGGMVTAAQRFSRTSTSTMLAQSEPLEAARAARVMKSMIPALHAKSTHLRLQLETLNNIEEDIDTQQQAHAAELRKINAEEEKLSGLMTERKKLFHQTEEERAEQRAEISRLTKESKNLDELVQKINTPRAKPVANVARTVGTPDVPADIYSPVPGTVRTAFGATDDLGAQSKGITYNARANARVVTPLAGTVRFAGPFHKYKHLLIVEHAGGYHSLIAGLGQVDAFVGARLSAGEPIGTVDTTDLEHHPVYYELRHNGTPINPQKILVAQRKQDKS